MSNRWAEYLKQFQKEYQEAEVDAYTELPDGKYNMKVEAVQLKISKTNRPMLEWEFVVVDGRYQGRREWKYHLLDKDRIGWLKRDLFRAGMELEDISQLEGSLPHLLDRILQIEIQTKTGDNGKTYRNIYIQKYIEDQPQSTTDDNIWMPPLPDNKIPF